MYFLINSTASLDIIAMILSIALVVWSFQIKEGKQLALIGGIMLFAISVLSFSATGFFAGKYMMNKDDHLRMEHKMMENRHDQAPHSAQ